MVARWKFYAIAFCACLLAEPAQAKEPQKQLVDLKYVADPTLQGCPSAEEFRLIVAQQLGYDPHRSGTSLGVEVRVRSSETGIEGTIEWLFRTASKLGERRFSSRSEDCHEMMTTVGFAVAVQIQLMAVERPPARLPRSETESSAPVPELEKPEARVDVSRAQVTLTVKSFEMQPTSSPGRTKWSAMAGIGSTIGLGLGPHLVGQGRLFLALQAGWVGVEAGVEASLPTTKREAYGGGFRHDLLLGTLAPCGWHGPIFICGLGKVGRIHVQGLGVDRPASAGRILAQLGPRLGYSLGLGNHLALLGHIEALYLLTPSTVDLNHVVVWTMPRFGAVAGIDLAARFR
jgi:hypothetical protein